MWFSHDDSEVPEREVFIETYHVRLYRDQGKLRLEALSEPLPTAGQHLQMDMFGNRRMRVHIYLDGVERDFKVLEPIQRKIGDGLMTHFRIVDP